MPLNFVPIEDMDFNEEFGVWYCPDGGTGKRYQTDGWGGPMIPETLEEYPSKSPAWVNRKYFEYQGYIASQVTDLFGEPFVYGAHEIWPYAQVQHIENTVLTRAAKLLATFLDKETAREFVEEERKSSDDAEPTAKSGESQ